MKKMRESRSSACARKAGQTWAVSALKGAIAKKVISPKKSAPE
jgi:hypothetical protein